MTELLRDRAAQRELVACRGQVLNVDCCAIHDGSPGHPTPLDRLCVELKGYWAMMRRDAQGCALPQQDRGILSSAKRARRLDDGVEYRLGLRGRTADHIQDVACGGLVFERLLQLRGSCLNLLEQPHILDRDHRLVGEGSDELDLLVSEGPHNAAHQRDYADRHTVAEERNAERRSVFSDPLILQDLVFRIGEAIRKVNRAALQRRAADQRASSGHERVLDGVLNEFRIGAVGCRHCVLSLLKPIHERVFRFAKTCCGLDDGIEDGSQLRRRAADDVEHVARRGLVLERFLQLRGPRLHLLEQPDIVDGDDGLVGEGLDELDLLVREGLNEAAGQDDDARHHSIPQQRDAERRAEAAVSILVLGVLGIRQDVGYLDRTALQCDPSGDRAPRDREWVLAEKLDLLRRGAAARRQVEALAPSRHDEDVLGLAEALRRFGDGVQHRLNVRWRAADDVEHVARRGLVLERFLQLGGPRLYFLKEADIVDRDHRLVREGGDEIDLAVGERHDLGACKEDHADHVACSHQRHGKLSACPGLLLPLEVREPRIGEGVGEVDGALLKRGEAGRGSVSLGDRMLAQPIEAADCVGVLAGGKMVEPIRPEPEEEGIARLAKIMRRLDDRIEHRLEIVGRAADHVQHVACGCLVFERLLQLRGARLDLLEQPHILDRDHGLVGEGRDELDLLLREGAHVRARKGDHANRRSIAEERHTK
jgi:hypothetical protein